MINYLGKFVPDMAGITAPLRKLLEKKDIAWNWTSEQQFSFVKPKKLVCEAPVLQYYDVAKPVLVHTDTPKDGVGAVLLQDNKPVA